MALVTAALMGPASAAAQDTDAAQEAVSAFNQGQDAHEKGDLNAAVALYQKALSSFPEFPEAEYQLGTALAALGRTEEAEKAFRRAVALKPEWSLALAKLGEVLTAKYIEQLKIPERPETAYKEASDILAKAISADADNFPAYAAFTDLILHSSPSPADLRNLLARLKGLTDGKANPPPSIWSSRAAVEFALGDLKAAKFSADRSLQVNPKDRTALYTIANVAIAENDPSRASDIIRALEPMTSDKQSLAALRARVLMLEGKTADAEKVLESVSEPSAEMRELKAKIRSAAASDIPVLEKQLETDPKDAAVLGRLCSLLRVDDPARALEFCRRASEAEPENVMHAIGYGAALVQAKRYAEAIGLFDKLLKFEPANATLHANRATALFQLKRFAEAKSEYRWLIQNQPNSPIAYYFLAITHDQLREYIDALANYQQFLKMADPNSSKLEIEKVNLRLPALEELVKDKSKKRSE